MPAVELSLNTQINSTDVTPLSIVCTTNIPASFPAAGWVVIDSEVFHYSSFSVATFTCDARAAQTGYGAGAAATHTVGAIIGLYLTAQAWNQLVAEVIAIENHDNSSGTIASAATTDLSTITARYINVTGTTTITAFGTLPAGHLKVLRFSGVLTLTHNATSLIIRAGANATTAAGDIYAFVSEGGGNWREVWHLTTGAAGTWQVLDRVISDTVVANTVADTTFYSKSIPGNTLGATGTLRLTAYGEWLNNSGGGVSFKPSVKLGATTMLSVTNGLVTANSANIGKWKLEVILQNTATGTQRVSAVLEVSGISFTTSWEEMTTSSLGLVGYGTASEDTTVAKTFAVSVAPNVASASATWTIHGAVLELLP